MEHYSYKFYNKALGFCKEENQLLDYHHKLAQLYQIADRPGKTTLKREMVRVREKYIFLESSIYQRKI